jgi:hypothetical protein
VLGSERALSALVADGFPVAAAVGAYLALIDYVLGSVFFDSARLDRYAGPTHPDPGHHAVLDAVQDELSELGSDRAFAFGLATFLDGLEHRRADFATRDH